MRLRLGEAFLANTSVLENCSAVLVSVGYRAYHDPGILLHYALRKKCTRELVRLAFANGIAQVVILGAGFDPLSPELQGEFPTARFWEIDHPATPRPDLPDFLAQATDLLRSNRTTVIYGTVRLIEKCYPQFKEFLDLKLKYDPAERFQSDWYRYYRKLFTS